MEIVKKQVFSENSTRKMFLFSNLGISFGILLITVGGGWDITNHLLNKPETFFFATTCITLFGSSHCTNWNSSNVY